MRDLSREPVKYLFLDGVNFKMRIGSSVEQVSVLVAVGATLGDHRKVLGLQSGEKESAGSWRQAFSVPSAPAIAQVFDRLPFLKRCTLFNP